MASAIFYPSIHAFCSSISLNKSTKLSLASRSNFPFGKSVSVRVPSLLKSNSSSRVRPRTNNKLYVRATSEDNNFSEQFDLYDDAFAEATVLEALEVQSDEDGFKIRMSNGKFILCKQNDMMGTLFKYPPRPAIVLKLADGSNILFPILVAESARSFLLQSIAKDITARPTIYSVILDMINKMDVEVKLVRITHREKENYLARIYISNIGDNNQTVMSLDIRPSDAINIAIKAKVPIQVSKALAISDGLRISATVSSVSFPLTKSTRFDKDSSMDNNLMAKEFSLVSAMELAISEERYADAAKFRDQLNLFRREIKRQKQV